jgi:hypothetical protein
MQAAQGGAPCASCGTLNAPFVNPYAAQPQAQWGEPSNAAIAAAPAWGCPACRHQNEGHYKFCLGCGQERGAGGSESLERRESYEGNAAYARPRSPVVAIVVIVAIFVALAIAGAATAFILAR